jgi:putative ABC transport system ATP-binding protein
MTAVRCIDLCKTYIQGDTEIKALDHLSIDIDAGGFVCLSSPSGGGKTTLLNAIGGLDIPDSGEVWIEGERRKAKANWPNSVCERSVSFFRLTT